MTKLRIRYQTIEFQDFDIHIRSLRDRQQFSDPEGEADALGISSAQWPLFGVIWESSEMLARYMESFEIEGKRILEVGCGLALSSLLLSHRDADITATDYHPEVAAFLSKNTELNNLNDIPFLRSDWQDLDSSLGEFDVIIGSDLLYEQQHIEMLSEFINNHAEKSCEIILVDPGRGQIGKFSKKMDGHGFTYNMIQPGKDLKMKIHRFTRGKAAK